jgi:AraC-like DNA-binding protein/quercetin dioxygenase-like cupin family protein
MNKDLLLEDRVHGDPMFSLNVYMVDYLDGEVIFHWHWHHEMEFLVMEEGRATIHIGMSEIILQKGEALFIPSGQLHAAYPIGDTPFRFKAIVFHRQLLQSSTYDVIQSKYFDPLQEWGDRNPIIIDNDTSWGQNVLASLSSIIHHYEEQGTAFELRIKGQLFLLFSEILMTYPSEPNKAPPLTVNSEKIKRLKQVLEYIDQHFHEKLTIKDLGAIIQMSEGHFSRFFKSLVKMTPIDYINHLRINKAAKSLLETELSILDISLEVGFDNMSYFNRMFKRQKKCTPSEFRTRAIDNHSDISR